MNVVYALFAIPVRFVLLLPEILGGLGPIMAIVLVVAVVGILGRVVVWAVKAFVAWLADLVEAFVEFIVESVAPWLLPILFSVLIGLAAAFSADWVVMRHAPFELVRWNSEIGAGAGCGGFALCILAVILRRRWWDRRRERSGLTES